MVNTQFGFDMSFPNSSPTPYGLRNKFVVPTGIPAIASGGSTTGQWCAVGNLYARLLNLAEFVECSITYVADPADINHQNVTQAGWYFWLAHLNNVGTKLYENYIPKTIVAGDTIQLSLHNTNGNWQAIIDNQTQGYVSGYQIINTPNTTLALTSGPNPKIFMESTTSACSNYTGFNQLQFTKFKYLNSSQSETTQNPSVVGKTDPALSCIIVDMATKTVKHS